MYAVLDAIFHGVNLIGSPLENTREKVEFSLGETPVILTKTVRSCNGECKYILYFRLTQQGLMPHTIEVPYKDVAMVGFVHSKGVIGGPAYVKKYVTKHSIPVLPSKADMKAYRRLRGF